MPNDTLSVQNLLKPVTPKGNDRKAWSIPLGGVWLPFFTATNTTGQTAIPADALGAPLRLAREKDGTPRFSDKGTPIVRVVKALSDQVKIVRENFQAGLMAHAVQVQKALPEQYAAQVKAATEAGIPVQTADMKAVQDYLAAKAQAEAALAQAEKAAAETREPVLAAA